MAVVGFLIGGLSMIPWLLSMNKDTVAPEYTNIVRIGAGISAQGGGDTTMMGSIPGVALFDIGGNMIGLSNPSDDDIHTWHDISITASENVKDTIPEYISLSAGKNPIFVSFITVAMSSGLKYAWVGDVAMVCGVPTYYTPVSYDPQSNGYSPHCVWLNGDPVHGKHEVMDGADLLFRGMGIHITDFSTPPNASKVPASISTNQTTAFGSNHDLFCKSQPRFWLYQHLAPTDYIPYFVGGLQYVDGVDADANKILDPTKWATVPTPEPVYPDALNAEYTKRDFSDHKHQYNTSWIVNNTHVRHKSHYRERIVRENITEMNMRSSYINTNIMKGHLVTSNATSHSASELCNNPSSAGPDFVSHFEQMYCDMRSKKTYPLCQDLKQFSCFDLDAAMLRPDAQGRRDTDHPAKEYVKVIDW